MTNLIVTTLDDEAAGTTDLTTENNDGNGLSLREALAIANANSDQDTITFDPSLSGGTITLGGTQLEISSSVIIDGDVNGDDKADITIDANSSSRVFNVTGGTDTLQSLTITGANGGAVNVTGSSTNLTIDSTTISGNSGSTGSAIYTGDLTTFTLSNSLVTGNSSSNMGTVTITGTGTINNSIIALNTAGGASGLYVYGSGSGAATVDVTNSILTGNRETGFINTFEELYAQSSTSTATVNVTDSIIANTGGHANIRNDGVINFSGTVIVSESFSPSSGSATLVSNLDDIFASTTTNVSVTGGALADGGQVVQTITTVGSAATIGAFVNLNQTRSSAAIPMAALVRTKPARSPAT